MALDHYISQVYLRKFLAPELGNLMYAMRKSNLETFTPRPKDVCRIENGSTNQYLEDERSIEDFLADIEGRYNASVDKFINDAPDPIHIYCVAGLISYFLTCSPAALRINAGPMRAQLVETIKVLERMGKIPSAPESLGGGSLGDLLDDGRVGVQVDPKYPGAIGVANIKNRVSMFGNSMWDILNNENEGCEFFTSDYPVAIDPTVDRGVVSRLVPLTPKIAVRITPDIRLRGAKSDFKFSNFRYRKIDIDAAEARRLNKLLVRSAEDAVFTSDWKAWRPKFIENHRAYRVDTISDTVPIGAGAVTHNRVAIVPYNR